MYRIADIDVKKNLYHVMVDLENYVVKEFGGWATLAYSHHTKKGDTTPVYEHPSKGGESTPVYEHPSKGGESTPAFSHPSNGGEFVHIDILDCGYAVLHSLPYRKKYKEFKEIDFLRLPYPKNTAIFWQLVKYGSQLRQLHVLESRMVEDYNTEYPIEGDNVIKKINMDENYERIENDLIEMSNPSFRHGRVYINDTQYFGEVPFTAWEFYIGGYQPAQKWLKDRKGSTLAFVDIVHYQKIIKAITETERLLKEIDAITID